MATGPIADIGNPDRVRCLLWCRARVRSGESEWRTDWKWMTASYVGKREIHRYATVSLDPTNPDAWFFHGWEGSRRDGVTIDQIEITHFHDLPDDPTIKPE